jgi:hypothetical protein
VPIPTTPSSGHFHAVRFYKDTDSLAGLVADFLAEGFVAALPAIVIATATHRAAIVKHLEARSIDVARLQSEGDLFLLDADDILAEFMVDGMPDPGRFRRAMVRFIEQACRGRRDCVIRAYGEMVDVLWKAGQTVAATRLETLWNDLAQSHAFSLLCGYAMGNFYKDSAQKEICDLHTHVLPDWGEAAQGVH